MRNALLAGVLASITCGVLGPYIVARRIVFISGGISHASFGGVGLGYLLGINPVWGAFFFAVLAALGIGAASRYSKREDAAIGIIWAGGMALGVLFIGLGRGYASDLFSYLFGNILTVPTSELVLIFLLSSFTVLTILALHKEFQALTFDEEYAQVLGLPVQALYFTLLGLIGLAVVILIRVVGIILVIALLTLPATISLQYAENLRGAMLLSTVLGVIFTMGGLWLSYFLDLPSGATIILLSLAGYLLSALHKGLKG